MTFSSGYTASSACDSSGAIIPAKKRFHARYATPRSHRIVTELLRINCCPRDKFPDRLRMPRKASSRDEGLPSEDALSVDVAPRRKSRARKSQAGAREMKPATMTSHRSPQESAHAFMRSGLLLAALRVWELKHGIHDYF